MREREVFTLTGWEAAGSRVADALWRIGLRRLATRIYYELGKRCHRKRPARLRAVAWFLLKCKGHEVPSEALALTLVADMHIRMGDVAASVENHLEIVRLLNQVGEFDVATQVLQKVLRLDPEALEREKAAK